MMELIRIEKLEMATAGLVVNLKKAMIKDTAMPPPPIPATTHRAITKEKVARPVTSRGVGGQTFLWPQYFSPSSDLILHL